MIFLKFYTLSILRLNNIVIFILNKYLIHHTIKDFTFNKNKIIIQNVQNKTKQVNRLMLIFIVTYNLKQYDALIRMIQIHHYEEQLFKV